MASKAREINETIRYTMWSVFRSTSALGDERAAAAAEVDALVADLASDGLEVRGWYDVAGLRGDADLMVWWHAADVETVAVHVPRLRRTTPRPASRPVWSQVALHRPAEFNKGHCRPSWRARRPARLRLRLPVRAVAATGTCCPTRSAATCWSEHGKAARGYPDVRANTVASFALGDYEWILAFEADELHRIVDLMRDLRATDARRHVREEIPFFTGPRVEVADLVERLP